jgi:hypothetical protein
MVVQELLPGRDDPGGITAKHAHIDELHLARLCAEAAAQPARVLADQGDHHRLSGVHAFGDERLEG